MDIMRIEELINEDIKLAKENKDTEKFFSEIELEKIGQALETLKDLKYTSNGVSYLNQYYAILLMLFSCNFLHFDLLLRFQVSIGQYITEQWAVRLLGVGILVDM